MKHILLPVIFFLLLLLGLKAQGPPSPQAFNYQAIARDNTGNPITNHAIALRFSILDISASGNLLYSETFNTVTNKFGLFNVNIGGGNVVSGSFSDINWAVNNKWLKVETDPAGGNNYLLMGISQFLSVPYSLYATNSNYAQNLPTTVSVTGDTLFLGNNNIIVPGISTANACRFVADTIPYTRNNPHAGDNPYNSFVYGLPKFIVNNFIELDKIDSISRFRSGVGHDYSDSYEHCSSMKHYFKPRQDVDWSSVKIYAPVNGTVINMFPDSTFGMQIWIKPVGMPAFNVTLSHVTPTIPLTIGTTVTSGQQVGTNYGPQFPSVVAVQILAPNNTFQRVSYFDVMTDQLYNCYKARGILHEDSFIIPEAAREADPLLPCGNGNTPFFYPGTIPNWVVLQH